MPLTQKGKKVMAAMRGEYGAKKGERVFYMTMNARKAEGHPMMGMEGKKKKGRRM